MISGSTDRKSAIAGSTDRDQGVIAGFTNQNQGVIAGPTDRDQGVIAGSTDREGVIAGSTDREGVIVCTVCRDGPVFILVGVLCTGSSQNGETLDLISTWLFSCEPWTSATVPGR